jgi:hypothetical protein
MTPFSTEDLQVFVHALFDRYSLGKLEIKPGTIKQHEQCIAFVGKGARMRKDNHFAIPYASFTWGVILPKSILRASSGADLKWMLNGQALGNTDTLIHIGSNSDQSTSLHASKAMLKAWTHANLDAAPAGKRADFEAHYDKNYNECISMGIFEDEVSIGHYVDVETSDTAKLKLQPISSPSFDFDAEETPAPSMGR